MPDSIVTIAPTTVISRYETSVVHINALELLYGNAAAVASAKAHVASAIKYHRTYLISGGVNDVWPWDGTGEAPAEPENWASLDAQLSAIRAMGGEPIMSTILFEWWHKGNLQTNGTTTATSYPTDQFTETGRLLTNQLPNELLRIQRMCERYMVPPYNLRIFLTGAEFHGFTLGSTSNNGSNLTYNRLAYHAFAGTAGANANMGIAYYHNQVAAKILEVAASLNIPRAEIKIGNCYPRIYSDALPQSYSVPVGHPLREQVWGTVDKRPLDALQLGLPLLDELDFVTFDFGVKNASGGATTDDWTNMQKYTAYPTYIRSLLTSIGLGSLPIMITEKYARPQQDGYEVTNSALRAALEAEAQCRMILAGVWMGSNWGFRGSSLGTGALATEGSALFTDVANAGGGQALPVLGVLNFVHDHFAPGTRVFALSDSEGLTGGLCSRSGLMLYNKTANAITTTFAGEDIELDAYETKLLPMPARVLPKRWQLRSFMNRLRAAAA